jgi:salicylate hydroxylase
MRVAVIGGGIAGLTAAIALRRNGISCTVYERNAEVTAAGAGIQLAPNGTRLLHRLGLASRLAAVSVRPGTIELRRWSTSEPLRRTRLGAAAERRYDAPYYTLHRGGLHRALLDAAGGIDIRTGRRCVAIIESASTVDIRFADGTSTGADAVLAADGIRSVVRAALGDGPARYRGLSVYRGVVPAAACPAQAASPAVAVWLGPGAHCACYPIAGGERVSFVAAVPSARWGAESWTQPGDPAVLSAAYDGWHADVRDMLGAATTVTRWALHDRPPPRRLCTGRIALLGDAAHPMLPFGAQGASQAIEDALVCAAYLRGASRSSVPDALRRYGDARVRRVARVTEMVERHFDDHHLPDGAAQRRRDAALAAGAGLASFDWLFGHDAERAALAAVACLGDSPAAAV